MAVKLIANYAKRLGLPGYSSHQFSVSVETELHDVENVAGESERLYALLQQSVDKQIQQTGFVPPDGYGMQNGQQTNGGQHRRNEPAGISERQLDLINKIVRENNLNKNEVEDLSVQMFNNGVRALDRMQASNLIDELFEKYGKRGNGRKPFRREAAHDRRG